MNTSTSNRLAGFASNSSATANNKDGNTSSPSAPAPATRTTGVSLAGGSNRGNLDSTELAGTITVQNSTDLNALAEAAAFASFGENINVQDSTFTNPGGGINLDGGESLSRTTTLARTTLVADVIKARSFNTGGKDALVIDGSRFDATRTLRLYATGDSNLRFKGNVTLNGPTVQLAGKTVTIDNGSVVRSNGNVTVYSDNHAYDRAGQGTLEAVSKGRDAYNNRPRY